MRPAVDIFRVGGADEADAYGGLFFRAYAGLVRGALRARWLVIVGLVGGTVACIGAFAGVKQQFFPPADTPIFYLNYKAAQGTPIEKTAHDLSVLEEWLIAREDVTAITASAGRGFTRFLLTYEPTQPDPSYGQIVIRASSAGKILGLRDDLAAYASEALPWAETRVQQIIYGPPTSADVEVRFSGPDPDVLRAIADEAQEIFEMRSRVLHTERSDWREREFAVRPLYASDRAQALGIDRASVAQGIALATDGVRAGVVRERDRLVPIVVRTPRDEVQGDGALLDRLVWSPAAGAYIPLAQVLDGFGVASRDTLIQRRDRVPTISVQAYAAPGVLPPEAFAEVRPPIEAIPLPPGYRMDWDGFFASMAVTIMAGLGLASVLTLIGVPALYHTYLRRERRAERAHAAEPDAPTSFATPHALRTERVTAYR